MSGHSKPKDQEVTPALFSGDARTSWVIGAVPMGSKTQGRLLLQQLLIDFPRHDPRLMAGALIEELLKLRSGTHGFIILGDVTCLSGMDIERSFP